MRFTGTNFITVGLLLERLKSQAAVNGDGAREWGLDTEQGHYRSGAANEDIAIADWVERHSVDLANESLAGGLELAIELVKAVENENIATGDTKLDLGYISACQDVIRAIQTKLPARAKPKKDT